jgi:prepilin-type N-terminal cleavage/methylation domain-containing protein
MKIKMKHKKRSAKSHRAKAHGLRPVGSRSALNPRSGFTLVEMLVAVSLVVLMMSLFATVFQLASGSIGVQRGIAENDQRARAFFTIIRNDLKFKSFKNLIPFSALEDPDAPAVTKFQFREGYFYISENDLNNDADDVLQFTVLLDGNSSDIYFGKAEQIASNADFPNSNEPDRDDGNPLIRDLNGILTSDNSSDSIAAEISYFLRGGRLYRRVLLLRQPLEKADALQPHNEESENYFDRNTYPNLYPANRNFWTDFDFSAHFFADGAVFNGIGGLDHEGLDNAGSGFSAIGKPVNRFGFSHSEFDNNGPDPAVPREIGGLPREYVGTGNASFIGRFTHEETSNTRFRYPHRTCIDSGGSQLGNGNPMDWFAASGENAPATTQLTLTNAGVVQEFGKGLRRAEDLLLSNVHAFDIKVWDDALARFVDVGHDIRDSNGNPIGDFNQVNRNGNPNYGPRSPSPGIRNRVFDTWHPTSEVRGDKHPPFRPMRFYPEPTPPGSTPGLKPEWKDRTDYAKGDVVFPISLDNGGRLPSPRHHEVAYRVVAVPMGMTDGRSGPSEPFWPTEDRDRIDDGDITWEAVKNLRPLRAIQITIRYLDISSDQLRQMTLQISMLPDE